MKTGKDGKGQPYVEWEQAPGGFKRAWIQRKEDPSKDWANAPRYLNVARVEGYDIGPAGNATDFPIFSNLSDEHILVAFVAGVSAITGCAVPMLNGAHVGPRLSEDTLVEESSYREFPIKIFQNSNTGGYTQPTYFGVVKGKPVGSESSTKDEVKAAAREYIDKRLLTRDRLGRQLPKKAREV